MEIIGLIFVRAHREQNFPLYVEILKALVPWFFVLDHHNYARWIPIHICDMENLPASILAELFKDHGHWIVQKTTNRFSAMPVDQAHEQNNEHVKGSGGAVGLTENPFAFRKWMVSEPEQARLLKEFERDFVGREGEMKYHHEEGFSTIFKEQAMTLADIISDLGNPFSDDSDELITLKTRNVMDATVVNTIRTVESLGQEQYQRYRQAVIIDHTQSIYDPIKKNSLPPFRLPRKKCKVKTVYFLSLVYCDAAQAE